MSNKKPSIKLVQQSIIWLSEHKTRELAERSDFSVLENYSLNQRINSLDQAAKQVVEQMHTTYYNRKQ